MKLIEKFNIGYSVCDNIFIGQPIHRSDCLEFDITKLSQKETLKSIIKKLKVFFSISKITTVRYSKNDFGVRIYIKSKGYVPKKWSFSLKGFSSVKNEMIDVMRSDETLQCQVVEKFKSLQDLYGA